MSIKKSRKELAGKVIVLGLTGGVACYKAAELCRALGKAGAEVHVAMTDGASNFITATTMQALSGRPVLESAWDARAEDAMAHIGLGRGADAIVVAPCTAGFISKLSAGACDDLLSTLCAARPRGVPLIIAPAMNVEMWENPANARNVKQLREDGIAIFGPAEGSQACGETGLGRMMEPEDILQELVAFFQPKVLAGKRVMVTAGPTFEAIDPVRGITNLSSGKMGYAIAQAAREAGAEVVLISGPTALACPLGVSRIDIRSAEQMLAATMADVGRQDVFVAVAAVADWRVANASSQKLKKNAAGDLPELIFEQNPDILATVAEQANAMGKPYCVGFAAESENLLEYGAAKRVRKGIPLLVGNIGQNTFGSDDNSIVLFDEGGHQEIPPADKLALARQLIAEIGKRLGKHNLFE